MYQYILDSSVYLWYSIPCRWKAIYRGNSARQYTKEEGKEGDNLYQIRSNDSGYIRSQSCQCQLISGRIHIHLPPLRSGDTLNRRIGSTPEEPVSD